MTPSDTPDTGLPAAAPLTAIAEWVADVLRDRIVKGEVPPGGRLVERKISAELNLSRTPVREALKLLHNDGLIEISRNKGAVVRRYEAAEALDLFEVIAALEGLAAGRLARTLTDGGLARIEALHARMMACHAAGDHTGYFDANSEIHDLIVAEAGNPVIQGTHRRLIARARRGRYLAIMDPARLAQAVAEHGLLMEALRARDAEAAEAIWRQHLAHTGESVARRGLRDACRATCQDGGGAERGRHGGGAQRGHDRTLPRMLPEDFSSSPKLQAASGSGSAGSTPPSSRRCATAGPSSSRSKVSVRASISSGSAPWATRLR
nr:GntR family transcriptional regulator [Mangrovicoccus ximenensis]